MLRPPTIGEAAAPAKQEGGNNSYTARPSSDGRAAMRGLQPWGTDATACGPVCLFRGDGDRTMAHALRIRKPTTAARCALKTGEGPRIGLSGNAIRRREDEREEDALVLKETPVTAGAITIAASHPTGESIACLPGRPDMLGAGHPRFDAGRNPHRGRVILTG